MLWRLDPWVKIAPRSLSYRAPAGPAVVAGARRISRRSRAGYGRNLVTDCVRALLITPDCGLLAIKRLRPG